MRCMAKTSNICDGTNYSAGDWQAFHYTQFGEMWDCFLWWCDCKCHCPDGHVSNSIGTTYDNTWYCNYDCRQYCINNNHMGDIYGEECYQAEGNCGYNLLGEKMYVFMNKADYADETENE